MDPKQVNHIGIAVNDLDASIPFYRDQLGMEYEGSEVVADQKVKVAFLVVGESRIELLEGTDEESPISKFIAKNGEGIHHVAYTVENIEEAIADMKEKGVRMIDEKPRKGAHNSLIAFLHPKASGGVLTELCQPAH